MRSDMDFQYGSLRRRLDYGFRLLYYIGTS